MADNTRIAIASGTGNAAAVAPTANLRLLGYSVAESAGSPAAASISIQEGTSANTANEISAISLAASTAQTVYLGEHGQPCPGGIYLNRLAGSTRVVIYYRISDRGKDSFDAPSW